MGRNKRRERVNVFLTNDSAFCWHCLYFKYNLNLETVLPTVASIEDEWCLPYLFFQGDRGFDLAHQLIGRALCVPGATVHWYDKPG